MKISQELSEKIEVILQEYISNPEPDWIDSDKTIDLRKIASELNVLPIYPDWSGAFGIRPNGEFFSFSYEKPYEIKTAYNQREINSVLFQAVKNYSELQELMPVRTPDSIECPDCDGTGNYKKFADHEVLSKTVVCFCGGLGWLPNENKL